MVPDDMFDLVLYLCNSYHPRLQFTIEVGNNKLNFLDVTIIKRNNFLIHDWYHKLTFSGRYLNFYSNHPINQKKGTVIGLIDRAFFLSHPDFHNKNFDHIINILLDNNYPLDFIYNICKQRLKYNFLKNNDLKTFLTNNILDEKPPRWFVMPYIHNFSEKFLLTFSKETDTHLAFYSLF